MFAVLVHEIIAINLAMLDTNLQWSKYDLTSRNLRSSLSYAEKFFFVSSAVADSSSYCLRKIQYFLNITNLGNKDCMLFIL